MNRLSAKLLIAANLVVAFMIIFEKWGYYSVLLISWIEAMIIGLYGLGRMCVACWFGNPLGKRVGVKDGSSRVVLSLVLGGFFIAKFGGFSLGLGFLVALTPGFLADAEGADGLAAITEGLSSVGLGVVIAAALLFISHGVSFFQNYVAGHEYRRSNALVLLFKPYLRMVLVLVVLAAGFAVTSAFPQLYGTTAFAVGIVLIKIFVDTISHALEHRRTTTAEISTPS